MSELRKITPAIERKIREIVSLADALRSEALAIGETIRTRTAERNRAQANVKELKEALHQAKLDERFVSPSSRPGSATTARRERIERELAAEQDRDAGIAAELAKLRARESATSTAWSNAGHHVEAAMAAFPNRHDIKRRMEGRA
jgi:chromosome segregation ATPase